MTLKMIITMLIPAFGITIPLTSKMERMAIELSSVLTIDRLKTSQSLVFIRKDIDQEETMDRLHLYLVEMIQQ